MTFCVQIMLSRDQMTQMKQNGNTTEASSEAYLLISPPELQPWITGEAENALYVLSKEKELDENKWARGMKGQKMTLA